MRWRWGPGLGTGVADGWGGALGPSSPHPGLCSQLPTMGLRSVGLGWACPEELAPGITVTLTSPPGLFSQECGLYEVTLALSSGSSPLPHVQPLCPQCSGTFPELISCTGCITDTQDWFLCTRVCEQQLTHISSFKPAGNSARWVLDLLCPFHR